MLFRSGKWTHRQYRTVLKWLDEQSENPSIHEHYLMQIACEVRRVLSKKPADVHLDHFKLKFKRQTPSKPETQEEAASKAKSKWLSMLGLGKKHGTE